MTPIELAREALAIEARYEAGEPGHSLWCQAWDCGSCGCGNDVPMRPGGTEMALARALIAATEALKKTKAALTCVGSCYLCGGGLCIGPQHHCADHCGAADFEDHGQDVPNLDAIVQEAWEAAEAVLGATRETP